MAEVGSRRLWEGFTANVGNALRSFFARTPQRQAAELQRGGTPAVSMAGLPYNLVNQFGYDALANYLRIDQDLQQRFADYEEMDEYPEVSCISADMSVFYVDSAGRANIEDDMSIVKVNSKTIGELAKDYEEGKYKELLVYAFDHKSGKVVVAKAKGPIPKGVKPVYKVTYQDFRRTKKWSIKATGDHLFMMRNGEYKPVEDLKPNDRLMPCTFKIRKSGYHSIYEPLQKTQSGGCLYTDTHRLVAQAMRGRLLERGECVHHRDENKANPRPSNLEIMTRKGHINHHQRGEYEEVRRSKISKAVKGQWQDIESRKRILDGQKRFHDEKGSSWLTKELSSKKGRYKKSGIPLAPDVVEASLRASLSVSEAARKLKVSWNTLARRMAQYGLDQEILGSNLNGPKLGDSEYLNHRVVSVEYVGDEEVFDLEVPGYRNFAVGTSNGGSVFVHNCGLDIYADDATSPDLDREQAIWATSEDKKIADELNHMLHKQLLIEDDIWGVVRTLCKYGNVYGEALVTDQGLVGLSYLPPPTVRRVEGPRGQLIGFIQDIRGEFNLSLEDFYALASAQQAYRSGKEGAKVPAAMGRNPGELTVFEDWELVHWRLRGKHLRSVYGGAVIDPARWIWKRLALLEDALLIYKLERAPARYAFYIDVGELDAERGLAFVNKVKNSFTRQKFVKPDGKLDMRFNPLPVAASTPIPLLDGRDITIEQMAKEYDKGKKHWVYSIDHETGGVTPGEVEWVGKTRENAETVRVTFDDGNWAEMAPDHPVMRRDTTYANAEDLKPGDSVMPLYRSISASKSLDGYELVYNPVVKRKEFSHRVMARTLAEGINGQWVTHHKDENKRNNEPVNLEVLSNFEHAKRHFDVHSKSITAYNKSDEKRKRTSILNRLHNTKKHIIEYNNSEKHKEDNIVRSQLKAEMWADPERARKAKKRMKLVFPEEFISGVKALIRENPKAGAEDIVRGVNEHLVETLREHGGKRNRNVKKVHRHMLLKMYRFLGFENFIAFKENVLVEPNNHKVVSVRKVKNQDQYCMTVSKHHNFALLARDGNKKTIYGSGVFVRNSMDEDFFVPVRGGKRTTEIDVISGPDYSETDTLEYHRDKLVSSIKIPKTYMGYGGESTRNALSSEDIRFARTIMRIQRVIRSGYRQASRIHLIAKGMNAKADYDIRMNVPSQILELARVEVMSATADLASRMKEDVGTRWVLMHLYKFSEDEAAAVMKEKSQEDMDKGKREADIEKMRMEGMSPEDQRDAILKGDLDVRLSKLMTSVSKQDWRRGFDGSKQAERKANDKLSKVLRESRDTTRRLKELGGLMMDIRGAFRSAASPPM